MKIKIKDFGPINEFEFDFDKDLHLIYGKNTVGKSYVAYCLYSLFKTNNDFWVLFFKNEVNLLEDLRNKIFEKGIKEFKKNKEVEKHFDITGYIENYFSQATLTGAFINKINDSIKKSFPNFLNLKNRYSNKDYSFEIKIPIKEDNKYGRPNYTKTVSECLKATKRGSKNIIFVFKASDGFIKEFYIKFDFKIKKVLKNTKTTKYGLYVNGYKYFATSEKDDFYNAIEDLIEDIKELIERPINKRFITENIYFLPASRSGLYEGLKSFSPILAELSQNQLFLKNKKIELPSLPAPESDFFINLSTFNSNSKNSEIEKLILDFEKDILQGEIIFDNNSKKLFYKPNDINLKLEMFEASSMVSELFPLVIFLRYIVKKNSVLFIEEPETHLHPEIQLKLMKFFTKLIKYGLKIIITSHSNYMMEKLTNLVLEKEISSKKIAIYHLIKKEKGTVVNPEMTIDENGILDENFLNATKELYEERMGILEKLNNE